MQVRSNIAPAGWALLNMIPESFPLKLKVELTYSNSPFGDAPFVVFIVFVVRPIVDVQVTFMPGEPKVLQGISYCLSA